VPSDIGVASGDRPVEYPLLGLDFEKRGVSFRDAVSYLREAWLPGGLVLGQYSRETLLDLLPKPSQMPIPMIVAGHAQQSSEWIATYMDGRFVYPSDPEHLARQAHEWQMAREALGLNPGVFISAFHLDLADDPEEAPTPRRFGARIGRKPLIQHLRLLHNVGVDHLALLLRPCRRPLDQVIEELSLEVLPQFGDCSTPLCQ
jgi:luciferase-type oxidoreductase